MWGQPAAGIGSLAALHVVVFVVDQCAACSAASDIKMLGLLRPEPSRAEPNRTELSCRAIVINCATEFGSNFAGKLRVAMRRQIRFGCSTQATVQPGPQVVEVGGVGSGCCRLLQLQLPRLELAPRLISNFDLEQIMWRANEARHQHRQRQRHQVACNISCLGYRGPKRELLLQWPSSAGAALDFAADPPQDF